MTAPTLNISDLRKQYMSTRTVLCTGNPVNPANLAHGIQKLFPEATFIHQSAGWDLTDSSDSAVQRLRDIFKKHNTFINASYIGPYVQSQLLELCNQSVKYCDVFNIGSTNEYDGINSGLYQDSKLHLRNNSLRLNTYRFKTHHIIVGGINKHDTEETKSWLSVDTVCKIIPWIMQQEFEVPIICVDQPKQAW